MICKINDIDWNRETIFVLVVRNLLPLIFDHAFAHGRNGDLIEADRCCAHKAYCITDRHETEENERFAMRLSTHFLYRYGTVLYIEHMRRKVSISYIGMERISSVCLLIRSILRINLLYRYGKNNI